MSELCCLEFDMGVDELEGSEEGAKTQNERSNKGHYQGVYLVQKLLPFRAVS